MKNPQNSIATIPAVVVGMCGHGLAITRALHKRKIKVYSLSADIHEPGYFTNSAEVTHCQSLKSRSLVKNLLKLHAKIGLDEKLPLFLTNDRMVSDITAYGDEIFNNYLLTWKNCKDDINKYLQKSKIEHRCKEVGLNYPPSVLLTDGNDAERQAESISYPVIIKPVTPLAKFKVIVVNSKKEVQELCSKYPDDMPFLMQKFILGDDRKIYFGAIYKSQGNTLARFEGHKLYSRPMGHTCLAESAPDDEINALTEKFYEGLNMSGPLSLEVKKDESGDYWVIEPTVGRSDFWLDVSIKNNVDLAYIEYADCLNLTINEPKQVVRSYWVNGERDPAGLLRLLYLKPYLLITQFPAFLYCSITDIEPFARSFARFVRQSIRRVVGKTLKVFGFSDIYNVQRAHDPVLEHVNDIEELSESDVEKFERPRLLNFDMGYDWFRILQENALDETDKVHIYNIKGIENHDSQIIFPLLAKNDGKSLTALANFYSSIYSPIVDGENSKKLLVWFFQWLKRNRYYQIDLHPMEKNHIVYGESLVSLRKSGWLVFEYFCFGNWYLVRKFNDYADYYNKLPAVLRNTIRRKKKKFFNDDGNYIELLEGGDDLERGIEAYQVIYNSSWKEKEPYPNFISALIHNYADRGQLRLGVAYINNEPAAAQIWIVDGNRAAIYKLAYDERFSRYSVGTVLSDYIMKYVIDVDKVQEVDYLIGDDDYKKDWMSDRRERWGIIAYNPYTLRGCAGAFNEMLRRKIKNLIFMYFADKKMSRSNRWRY